MKAACFILCFACALSSDVDQDVCPSSEPTCSGGGEAVATPGRTLLQAKTWGRQEVSSHSAQGSSKEEEVDLIYSSSGRDTIAFYKRSLHEGVRAWSDRSYTYTNVSQSGIPEGTEFWAGPHKSYPGRNRAITLASGCDGTLYFWSETGYRDGGFDARFAANATGGYMDYEGVNENKKMDVYKIDVVHDESEQLPIEGDSRFVGGFAFQAEDANLTYSSSEGTVSFEKRSLSEVALAWTDRTYTYTNISQSGIPLGSTFWAGPHKEYPGTDRFLTVTSRCGGSLYFWSETGLRDGGFDVRYAANATGGYMNYEGVNEIKKVDVYKIKVAAGERKQIPIEGDGASFRFVGGFAWQR